ncbi:MAG TPA: polymer-forming cytoskeletal protein [Vicinamibacterales bacterium]|jgi:cytoskeletal protein CcmA (bactofilin family)|nr:polymer-forming cytoskeletal protein [Vicinamibacterales bacterium]
MEATGIGPSIHIKGTISSQEPLIIAGRVIGSIDMPGYALTISPTASVDGDVAADGITIGGKTHGRLNATSRIAVHETATVEGTLSTPVISVADGAAIHGDCLIEGRKPN